MDYRQILGHLYSLESSKIKLGLKNIKALLKKLGNPEKELKCIHVAGTNGKGSVCAMIFYILRQAGYNVGLYTSPHLKRFNERIRANDDFISDREIVDYYLGMKGKITNQSFFEITTAMAFLYFKEKKVDFVVLEVGLGGRLDATNVVKPLISIITNIDYEHTNLLGNTLEKIAYEKAGIIKRNVPAVTGAEGIALGAIKRTAARRNSPLILAKRHKKIRFKYLNGNFQHFNSTIALTTIGALKKYYNKAIEGIENTKWKGRLEFIGKNVLVDCAHNPNGIKALAGELKAIKKSKKYNSMIIVFGVLKDKNAKQMLEIISKANPKLIVFTMPNSDRALVANALIRLFKKIDKNKRSDEKIDYKSIANPKMALSYAKGLASLNDLIVVTGSIYLIGEII